LGLSACWVTGAEATTLGVARRKMRRKTRRSCEKRKLERFMTFAFFIYTSCHRLESGNERGIGCFYSRQKLLQEAILKTGRGQMYIYSGHVPKLLYISK
jgi:hypothetical protein